MASTASRLSALHVGRRRPNALVTASNLAYSVFITAGEENEPATQSTWRNWKEMMTEELGERELMAELCNSFHPSSDPQLLLIIAESLK